MWRGMRAAALALVLMLHPGCGEDKAVGPKPTEITGLWTVTKDEYVNKANPALVVNRISPDSIATCAINADKSWVFILRRAGGHAPDTTIGTWSLDGDEFHVVPTETPFVTWAWGVNLSSNTLTLTGADMWFDFNGDSNYQVEEEAKNNRAMVK